MAKISAISYQLSAISYQLSAIPMHEHELMSLGLTDKEAAVYEALLRSGHANMPKLLEVTAYKRGDLYNILAGLRGWGLVEVDERTKTYTPVHPQRLEELLREQEKEVEQAKKSITQTIPEFVSMFRLISGKPGVRFFEGKEGFREALYDTLSATEAIYTYVDLDAVKTYADDVNRAYVRARQKKGLDKKLLVFDTPGAREYLNWQGTEHTDVRFLPKALNPFHTGMQIYNNKISYFTLREKHIFSVLVEDPDIYRMHRNMFEFFWNLQGGNETTSDNKNTVVKHGDGNVSVFGN